MDHLAPTTGVNWYTNYNAFGELLGNTQLPPLELGGVEVGRSLTSQVNMHYPTQPLPSSNLTYIPDHSVIHSPETEQSYAVHESSMLSVESIGQSRTRPALGEKKICLQCGSTFACGANLRNHMRIHTGERPFVCEECGVSFTQRSNLRSHKRVHTGERPYMCGICGQTFARSSHLPGHVRTHTGEKPFHCTLCGRNFATNQIMKNHMRTHTGERPFVCDVCDATFAQSSCLATHKKIHTGERNFKCVECGKAFISRSGLQTHQRVHTGEKPYSCEKCSKSFKTSSYLSKHKQKYCGNGYKKKMRHPDAKKPGRKPGTSRKICIGRKMGKSPGKSPKRCRPKRLRRSRRYRRSETEEDALEELSDTLDFVSNLSENLKQEQSQISELKASNVLCAAAGDDTKCHFGEVKHDTYAADSDDAKFNFVAVNSDTQNAASFVTTPVMHGSGYDNSDALGNPSDEEDGTKSPYPLSDLLQFPQPGDSA